MKEKAFLIDIVPQGTPKAETDLRFMELESLVKTYGGIVVLKTVQKKSIPSYSTYVGTGKVTELLDEIEDFEDLDVIVVNNILKPRQIYNLEELCTNYQIQKRKEGDMRFENPKKIKVWDRVDLILKIFDKHAQTAEAKLQIELASIQHMGPRIFGMGLELSRQAGGIGTLGVGETNIQIMKRHLQKRTKTIEEKIKYYSKIQKQHRKQRRGKNFKTVSLVGYTNAGKSTLITSLTKKKVYVADELFATLDSRAAELYLPGNNGLVDGDASEQQYKYEPGVKAIITDTIGFIQDLPPELIEAFKSTLAEILEADLLLHVIDISDPNMHKKISVVEEILDAIGCTNREEIYIFNKMDMLDEQIAAGEMTEEDKIQHKADILANYGEYSPQFITATDKKALGDFLDTIRDKLTTKV